MKTLIEQLLAGKELTEAQVAEVCQFLFEPDAPIEPRASLLEALGKKGETPSEIAWFVQHLLARARRLPGLPADDVPTIDVCGTGGDRLGLFNISTAVMFVIAACGARVVKHGNRGITSKCGGADVLEALDVSIDLPPETAARVLADVGCVFLFAPQYHPAFREIAPVRKFLAERGVVTVFNKLGPLLNPACPAFQLAGVFDPAMIELYAKVFVQLGRKRAWAVHGETPAGGLDEMSTFGRTHGFAVEHGRIERFALDSADHGIARPELDELEGGGAEENAARLEALLRGKQPGSLEDIVAWNAAGALVVAGIADDIGDGLERARDVIRNGEAAARLDALRAA